MSPLGNILMKKDAEGNATISPETAARIDQEVARLVDQSYQTALDILRQKKDKLIAIAEHLIEVETIDGSELDAMLFGDAA
jgi:cell division protease FtsH